MHIEVGDLVCFGERLGDFGKIPYRVTGIEQRADGFYIKTLYNNEYIPASMLEKCS